MRSASFLPAVSSPFFSVDDRLGVSLCREREAHAHLGTLPGGSVAQQRFAEEEPIAHPGSVDVPLVREPDGRAIPRAKQVAGSDVEESCQSTATRCGRPEGHGAEAVGPSRDLRLPEDGLGELAPLGVEGASFVACERRVHDKAHALHPRLPRV